jgi:peroxin-6
VDKSKQDPNAAAPQTIAEAMEAFNLGDGTTIEDAPSTNGDRTPTGSIRGRINKGLNKWPGGLSRSASGQSTNSTKGKGKSRKGKGPRTAESDGSVDGDEEDLADGAVDDDDDYVVRTDHLANPMEEVE